ncbi:MAG: CheR family methyltransferase [Pontibacterium sp.]
MSLTAISSQSFTITDEDFLLFCQFLEEGCGIVLASHKQYLVQSRLSKIMVEASCGTLKELIVKLKNNAPRGLKERVIDAMTTNETLWFRDGHPFEIFRTQILPEFASQGGGRLRVWSAACSSGQEPYSLNMVFDEYKKANLGSSISSVDIVATDISSEILAQAKSGTYENLAIGRGLSPERQAAYFDELPDGRWQIKREMKANINFQSLNLMGSFQAMGLFDVIFCRNVLIYFSADKKREIITKLHKQLKPNGYLFLGASESMSGLDDLFEMVHCRPGILYKAI